MERLNLKERLALLADIAELGVDYLIYDVEEWEIEATAWIRQLRREARRLSIEAIKEIPGQDN
jgi:hypothetical protein